MAKRGMSPGWAVSVAAILALGGPWRGAGAQDGPGDAAAALLALRQEYGAASGEFRKATTDEQRKAAVEHLRVFPLRFVELAGRHPADASAVEALVEAVRAMNAVDSLTMTSWDMSSSVLPTGGGDDAAARATALLSRHHLRSEKLGAVCERMQYGVRKEMETFLRSVLALSPHREVQAIACMALARFLGTRVHLDLRVRVKSEWRDDDRVLDDIGVRPR